MADHFRRHPHIFATRTCAFLFHGVDPMTFVSSSNRNVFAYQLTSPLTPPIVTVRTPLWRQWCACHCQKKIKKWWLTVIWGRRWLFWFSVLVRRVFGDSSTADFNIENLMKMYMKLERSRLCASFEKSLSGSVYLRSSRYFRFMRNQNCAIYLR